MTTIELTTPIIDPATGRTRVVRTLVKIPTLSELMTKLRAGALFKDDLVVEVIDVDTGEVIDLVDPTAGLGWAHDLVWRCDVPPMTRPQEDPCGDEPTP